MKIQELLLPKSFIDKDLSTHSLKKVDLLQTRMDLYVDKICKLAAGAARDFLKTQLRADYNSLKDIIKKNSLVAEAIHKLPLTPEDFKLVEKLMERPIPAAVAGIYITEIIDDDELNDQFKSLEDTEPNRDVRPLIVEWFRRVMPDQMHRFGSQEVANDKVRKGILSPIHGYDSKEYSGSSFTSTGSSGNAYGRF